MKIYIPVILLLFAFKTGVAQEFNELKAYLDSNSTPVNMNDPARPNNFFKSVMSDKVLFVFGEGGDHQLDLQNKLRVYLLNQFSRLHLKYFFIESGRSTAYIQNKYLQNTIDNVDSIFKKGILYKKQMQKIRQLYQDGYHFMYKGIDMEWSVSLYNAVKDLTADLSQSTVQSIPLLRSILIDTNYLHYDDNNVFNNQKEFLNFYISLHNTFTDDADLLKNVLGNDRYEQLEYFLSNPQTRPPRGNRNPGMAKNLLNEIVPIEPQSTYLLGIGMAHTLLNRNGVVASMLERNELLRNKIVVMNTYCDECQIAGKIINDRSIEFMKNELLDIFRSATKSDLTIFDLSKLPSKFNYLKEYGDLILFAKNQE